MTEVKAPTLADLFAKIGDLTIENAALQERNTALEAALRECVDAFHYTREYQSEDLWPNIEGWAHYDAVQRASVLLGEQPQ